MKLQIIHKGKYSWHSYRFEIGLKPDDVCKIWSTKKKKKERKKKLHSFWYDKPV